MKHQNAIPNSKITTLLVAFAFAVFCSSSMVAQNQIPPSIDEQNSNQMVASESRLDLIFWVMGAHQSKGAIPEHGDVSHKKKIINSGMVPNRILSRTFLNKAINYDSTIA